MKKLQIFIDADETLMDFMTPLVEKYNDIYDKNVTNENIKTWNLNESLEKGTDMEQFMNEPNFFRNLKPYPNAAKVLKQLIDDGHDVFIATSAWQESIQDKYESFAEHFPFLKFEQILMIKRKDVLHGDILLDDALHNITVSNCTYPVTMDKPWNKEHDGIRVKDLNEFYDFVCEIAGKKNNELIA